MTIESVHHKSTKLICLICGHYQYEYLYIICVCIKIMNKIYVTVLGIITHFCRKRRNTLPERSVHVSVLTSSQGTCEVREDEKEKSKWQTAGSGHVMMRQVRGSQDTWTCLSALLARLPNCSWWSLMHRGVRMPLFSAPPHPYPCHAEQSTVWVVNYISN